MQNLDASLSQIPIGVHPYQRVEAAKYYLEVWKPEVVPKFVNSYPV